jgi:cation diffusion facilitator family transporter
VYAEAPAERQKGSAIAVVRVRRGAPSATLGAGFVVDYGMPGSLEPVPRERPATDGSTRVVYAALGGNLAIALAKFVAYGISGSSAMLTETIHSLVDSVDQILLLVGQSRGRRPPDAGHPLGHGMESYFWSLIVAVMVLLLGGGASLYQGVQHILAPETIQSPAISFTVLGIAAVFEGSTLAIGLQEFKRVVRGRDVTLWTFIRVSKDPSLYASLLEDSAALVGIAIAALGVLGAALLHVRWADGAASIAIGSLLTAVAIVLANETRSLIAGEAVAPTVMADIRRLLSSDPRIEKIVDIATLHLGPKSVLVALTLSFTSQTTLTGLRQAIRDLTIGLKQVDGRIAYVYVRPAPDFESHAKHEGAAEQRDQPN